jgi:hypothetical protein
MGKPTECMYTLFQAARPLHSFDRGRIAGIIGRDRRAGVAAFLGRGRLPACCAGSRGRRRRALTGGKAPFARPLRARFLKVGIAERFPRGVGLRASLLLLGRRLLKALTLCAAAVRNEEHDY